MKRLACLFTCLSLVAGPADAVLNEFSGADGYQDPFNTRVWTYNSLWSLDGGSIDNNYVAQHGYGGGFPFGEPFALVIRNDNAAGNYAFSYAFEPFDLAGENPGSLNNSVIEIKFDVCAVTGQNSLIDNGAEMLTMKFGGTSGSPGVVLAFSDGNHLMYSDGSGNLIEFTSYELTIVGWDRVTLTMDFANDTYDLVLEEMTGASSMASNTWTPTTAHSLASGMPFVNPQSSMPTLHFETFTDPENGLGWHKTFLDNFDGTLIGSVPTLDSSWGAVKKAFK